MKALKAKEKSQNSIGKQFSRLTILAVYYLNKGGPSRSCLFYCLCECGNPFIARMQSIRSGGTKSCGCLNIETITKHGYARHFNTERLRLYQIWSGLKQRCFNTKKAQYSRYGGRGISVCEKWLTSFETFLKDMGPRPSKEYSIDRRDNSKGYSPENCYWATKKQQAQNTSFNIMITFGSTTRSLSYWCELFGIDHGTVLSRVNRSKKSYSFQEALTAPVIKRKKRAKAHFRALTQ